MALNSDKSYIKEGADQLFVDSAYGFRLDILANNLGLTRPNFNFQDDDKFRAAIKKLAFKYKGVNQAFISILEIVYGPQFSRCSDFAEPAYKGDRKIVVNDVSKFVICGDLKLDKGLINEEKVTIARVDLPTNTIYLKSSLKYNHLARQSGQGILDISGTTIGNATFPIITNYPLQASTALPTSNVPYPILLKSGKLEELKHVQSISGGTSVTCTANLANKFVSFRQIGVKSSISSISTAGIVKMTDTSAFGKDGYLLISAGNSEAAKIVYYYENNIEENYLKILESPTVNASTLTSNKTIGEKIEIETAVETCSVLQEGTYWDLFESRNRNVFIHIPDVLEIDKLRDVAFLHANEIDESTPSVLNNDLNPTDKQLIVDGGDTWPNSGYVLIDGTDYLFYYTRDEVTFKLLRESGLTYPAGTSISYVTDYYSNLDEPPLDDGNMREASPNASTLIPRRFTGSYVYTGKTTSSPSMTKTTVASQAAAGKATGADSGMYVIPGENRTVTNQDDFSLCLETLSVKGWDTDQNYYVEINKGHPNYEKKLVDKVFYKEVAVTGVKTATLAGDTSITGIFTADFPSSVFIIRIGAGTANEEVVNVATNTISTGTFAIAGALINPHSINERIELEMQIIDAPGGQYPVGTTQMQGDNLTKLPQSASDALNYRVIIGRGTLQEEILTVKTNNSSILTFKEPTKIKHFDNEIIELYRDVIMFDSLLQYPHKGDEIGETSEKIQPIVTSINVTDASDFTNTGKILLNHGNVYSSIELKVDTIDGTGFTTATSVKLPQEPFFIKVRPGTAYEEVIPVKDFDGSNTISWVYAPRKDSTIPDIEPGDTILFEAGQPEEFTYASKVSNTKLSFANGIKPKYNHYILEPITLIKKTSIPAQNADDYQFFLPSDLGERLRAFIEIVRAAGVEVEFGVNN